MINMMLQSLQKSIRDYVPKSVRKFIRNYTPSKIVTWIDNQWYKTQVLQGKDALVPKEELKLKYREALLLLTERLGADKLGDYLEFGVCHGTSLACMNQSVQDLGLRSVRLFGFDSFEGLPEIVETDDEVWSSGQFKSEYEFTKKILTSKGIDWNRTILVKGWFSDTLNNDLLQKHKITKASVIMIDCDMYSSTKTALDFCAKLIQDEAIIFFDDWNPYNLAEQNKGEKRAFTEFLHNNLHFTVIKELGSYTYNFKCDASTSFLVARK